MIEPLFDRVIVKPIKQEEKLDNGLFLPEGLPSMKRPNEAIVVAVGPGTSQGMPLKVGDRVIFQPKQASAIDINGLSRKVVALDGIDAIVESVDEEA